MPDNKSSSTETKPRRYWSWPMFMALWTVLVMLALWLLIRLRAQMASSAPVIVHAADAAQTAFGQKLRDWLMLAHLNFARVYPWILCAPYVLWFASRFHLEHERLKLHLPALIAGCVLFVFASHAINSQISVSRTRVVLFTSEQRSTFDSSAPHQSKMMKVEVTGASAGALVANDEFFGLHQTGGAGLATHGEFPNGMPTNLLQHLDAAMKPPLGKSPPLPFSPFGTLMDVMAYSSLAGLAHAVLFHRRYRERERRALALESSLSKARLSALQAQLQPHFLFNTLNAIATLLRRDPLAAEATLLSLSELLRLSLNQSQSQEIPLREELRFLERYLEIQGTRFGDRLRVEQQIDPAALDCLVPTLILQPLVENAIRHGFEPSGARGLIRIQARRQISPAGQNGSAYSLALTVEDDGIGLTPNHNGNGNGANAGNGIGLSNLRTRLETLYGSRQTIQLEPRAYHGVVVKIELPWHEDLQTKVEHAGYHS
jgi:two-component sensor histidine kinase